MHTNDWRQVLARLQLVGSLLVLLSSCAIGVLPWEPRALFPTPEAALADALGTEGWLDPGLGRMALHQQLAAPGGTIVLYSGYQSGRLVSESADAKPRAGQWYAHGMLHLPMPPLSGTQRMSCAMSHYQSSGATITSVTGHVHLPAVRQIVAVFDSGTEQQATMRDDAFMVLLMEAEADRLRELLLLDASGAVVERIMATSCQALR